MELIKKNNNIKWNICNLAGILFTLQVTLELNQLYFKYGFSLKKDKGNLTGVKVKLSALSLHVPTLDPCQSVWRACTGVFQPYRSHDRFQPHSHIYQWVESLVVGSENVMPVWESLGTTCLVGFARLGRSRHSWQCVEWREDCVCSHPSVGVTEHLTPLQREWKQSPVCVCLYTSRLWLILNSLESLRIQKASYKRWPLLSFSAWLSLSVYDQT